MLLNKAFYRIHPNLYALVSSLSISRRSPGVQSRASHRAISVENLIAFALPHFSIERLASVIPTFSDSSERVIRRLTSIRSRLTLIAAAFKIYYISAVFSAICCRKIVEFRFKKLNKEQIMDSCESADNVDQKKIDRRTFFARSLGCTAGLTLLAFPGVITSVFASNNGITKEEIFSELEAKVEKSTYGACSQRSFAPLNEQFLLNADETIPALLPFAGGIAGSGETCGAVSGSLLAIGFYFESIKGNRGSSMGYAKQFVDRFTQEFGSTRCRDVMKKQFGGCVKVMQKAVVIAGDIILANP